MKDINNDLTPVQRLDVYLMLMDSAIKFVSALPSEERQARIGIINENHAAASDRIASVLVNHERSSKSSR